MNDKGYYNHPAISGNTVYFTSEDDLWSVPSAGGIARRLTSGLGWPSYRAASPDGRWLAFSTSEEGGPRHLLADGGLTTQPECMVVRRCRLEHRKSRRRARHRGRVCSARLCVWPRPSTRAWSCRVHEADWRSPHRERTPRRVGLWCCG
jgi:WD40-like Beta Propeller Repeat